jgi:hypothetical protein
LGAVFVLGATAFASYNLGMQAAEPPPEQWQLPFSGHAQDIDMDSPEFKDLVQKTRLSLRKLGGPRNTLPAAMFVILDELSRQGVSREDFLRRVDQMSKHVERWSEAEEGGPVRTPASIDPLRP